MEQRLRSLFGFSSWSFPPEVISSVTGELAVTAA